MNASGNGGPTVSASRSHPGSDEAGRLDNRADEQGREGPRILIVAVSSQELSPRLLEAVRERAAAGPTQFHLVLPDPAEHAEMNGAQRRESRARGEEMLERALSLLSQAAGYAIYGSVSPRHDPMDVIEETLADEQVDEVMLAITHHRLAERLHLDLPHRVEHLHLPVTTVMDDEQTASTAMRRLLRRR
jgi:siroheme synthase (precorrin-2 oxidase/ferrochelatase)